MDFSTLLSSIEAEAKAVETKIVAVAEAFAEEIIGDVEIAAEDLAPIAISAVLSQASAVVSGTEKFGNAVTGVIQTVEAQGKGVLLSTAQTAVQQAYSAVATVANAATPPAAA